MIEQPTDFGELLGWIEQRTKDELRSLVENVILDRRPLPFLISPAVDYDYVIVQLVRSSSASLQLRFRDAIFELLYFSSAEPHLEAFSRLLVLIGLTGNTLCREHLVPLANRQTLKGRFHDGEDLHLRLLRVLVGLGVRRDLHNIFERDLAVPSYTPICYRGLWEIKLRDVVTYLPEVTRVAMKNPSAFSFPFILSEALDAFGRGSFLRRAARFPRQLVPSELAYLLAGLRGIGIVTKPSEDGAWMEFVDTTQSVENVEDLTAYRFFRADERGHNLIRETIREELETGIEA